MISDSSDEERFVLRRSSKNPNIPIGTRRSLRQLSRGTLHIDAEPAAEIQEKNSGNSSDTSSDDGEESDENYQPGGQKRSGRFMRGNSSSGGHGVSSGNCGDQQGDEEEEGVQSGQPALIEGVVLKKPSVPHDYIKVDYLKRGMTEKAKKEREKNPLHVRKGRSTDYRFQTKFHQHF